MSEGMKDSGVEWIGEIPEGWSIGRTKDFLRIVMGQSPDSDSVFLKDEIKGIPFSQGCSDFGKLFPEPQKVCLAPKKTAKPLDVLISVRAPVGKVNLANQVISIGRGLCALSCYKTKLDPMFLFYLAESVIADSLAVCVTGSTFDAVSVSDIATTFIPKITLGEQQLISNYLDRETSLIDRRIGLIEKKRELLGELRKSVIHRAVTKGLDAGVKMKDSGVEWIGEIPASWNLMRVGDFFKCGMGETILSSDLNEDGFPIYSATKEMNVFGYKRNLKRLLKEKTLIIGARGTIGYPKIVEAPCGCTQTTIWCEGKSSAIDSKYYFYLLGLSESVFDFDTTAMPMLTVSTVNSIRIVAPPLPEQKAIADFLDRETSLIDKMDKALVRQVDFLKEQRKTLIHEVVTGKKRVKTE